MAHPFLTNDAFDVFYITKRTQNNHVPICKHKTNHKRLWTSEKSLGR